MHTLHATGLVLLFLVATAHADVLSLPPGKEPVPLLVVLHGDRERARAAAARWAAAIKQQGWALFAPDCPRALGCKDSFWQWDGDPSWLIDAVARVQKQRTIKRVYLAGWSGGATYIGWHVHAWPSVFAAIVVHGGGAPPADPECVTLPAYFLVGDKNPLHHLAQQLRAYFDACKQPIVWDVVHGGGHADESAALTRKKALAILGWLEKR